MIKENNHDWLVRKYKEILGIKEKNKNGEIFPGIIMWENRLNDKTVTRKEIEKQMMDTKKNKPEYKKVYRLWI